MKKMKLGIVIVVVLILLFIFAAYKAVTPVGVSSDEKTFVKEKAALQAVTPTMHSYAYGDISFQYPDGWRDSSNYMVADNPYVLAYLDFIPEFHPDGQENIISGDSYGNIAVTKEELPPTTTLDAFLSSSLSVVEKNIQAQNGTYTLIENSEATVDSIAARHIIYEQKITMTQYVELYAFIKNNKAYVAQLVADKAFVPQELSVGFNRIIATLTVK